MTKADKRRKNVQTEKATTTAAEREIQIQHKTQLTKLNLFLTMIILLPIGYYYMRHLETLFENDKHFSHLSTLERELSFRTESGLYYYYFKQLVSKQSISKDQQQRIVYKYKYNNNGLIKNIYENIINDNRTEYPSEINALQRFNLYPEIVVSMFYHLFYRLNLLEQQCWTVNRGDEMPPVQSCVGYAEPIYFYSKSVFVIHGFSFMFLFLLCWLLNDYSIVAGLIGCLCYLFNHSEATRVMWTPALRESFAYPFHVLQLVLITRELRFKKRNKIFSLFLLMLTTLVYLLTWQFAQFSLGTQAAALYFTYILGYINKQKLIRLMIMHSLSLSLGFVFMFANRMLLASFFSSILFTIWLLIGLDFIFKAKFLKNFLLLRLSLQLILFFILLIFVKKFILPLICFIDNDDTHIWDILKSKLSVFLNKEFHTFDTRLYTCAREFDFLEYETIVKLSKTLLLPVVCVNIVYCVFKLVGNFNHDTKENNDDDDENRCPGHVVYNLLQLAAFTLMAVLIMRLKLFWTPHLCVIATLMANERFSFLNLLDRWFMKGNLRVVVRYSIVVLLIAIMSSEGVENINKQYKIMGEYNDYPMENLVNWINLNTKLNNSFAGSMPTMANVKLSTNRAILIHPHYENNDLRTRTRLLYTYMYGYKDIKLLYNLLKNDYKIDYLVIENYYCLSHQPGKPECGLSKIAHLNDDVYDKKTNQQACYLLIYQDDLIKKYFKKVFEIQHITVHKVL